MERSGMAKMQLKSHPFDCFVSLTFLAVAVAVAAVLHYLELVDLNLSHGFLKMAARQVEVD
jgi:hypothetical protein